MPKRWSTPSVALPRIDWQGVPRWIGENQTRNVLKVSLDGYQVLIVARMSGGEGTDLSDRASEYDVE